ncbi:MAG: inner membrane protein YhjD, partial [Mycobacterium sp.]|uniref:inner membrane protein YhjD n=1 Tax=Mycobacterium sp. TaxID=1785 RepID=UPI003CC65694
MTDPARPGILDRLRARYGWFDHVMRANERFTERKGNFYAAGLTYYTIFALFPLLMVLFAVAGFALSRQPALLAKIEIQIKASVSGHLGKQLLDLMNSAIDSRTSVGIVGLALAMWVGLGWMANLREALSQMWQERHQPAGFVRTKLSDLLAMASSFAAIAVTVALTAIGNATVMGKILHVLGIHYLPLLDALLRCLSVLVSVLVSWVLFTWMIARLPRESISFDSAARAAFFTAIAFEAFKQIATIYLRSVLKTPAAATFGPVLGLMVFAYITARLILFATAWAATSPENLRAMPAEPPDPAIISPRVQVDDGLRPVRAVAAVAVGALSAFGLSQLWRWRGSAKPDGGDPLRPAFRRA